MILPAPGWLTPAPASQDPPAVQNQQEQEQEYRQQTELSGGLLITYDNWNYDGDTGVVVFEGNVVAEHQSSKLVASRLELNEKTKTGTAIGGVTLTDPEGTITAGVIEFAWSDGVLNDPENAEGHMLTARAEQADIRLGNTRLYSDSIKVFTDRWELAGVKGTLSREQNPSYWLEAERAVIFPGDRGVAYRLHLRIKGTRIGPLPSFSFSLNQRQEGMSIPSVRNDKEKGLGVTWDYNRALTDHSTANISFSSFKSYRPSYGASYAYSPLTSDATSARIAPIGDMGERFGDNWFDNIRTQTWAEEDGYMRQRRLTYGVGSYWNIGTAVRPDGTDDASKMIELVYETGGPIQQFGTWLQGRLQRIRSTPDQDFRNRILMQGAIQAPAIPLTNTLDFRTRADIFGTLSEEGVFGFARMQAGVVWKPNTNVTMGAAYVFSGQSGKADFGFDRLHSAHAWHLRADWTSGPYTVRGLAKHDPNLGGWYDYEYEVALVAEAFEPFIVYRKVTSDFSFGIRFRIGDFVDRLRNRSN